MISVLAAYRLLEFTQDGRSASRAVRTRTAARLSGLDVLVCDIQDIGGRYYTYTWTVSHILEAAGQFGVDVVILDRPNPLGGDMVDLRFDEAWHSSWLGTAAS